MVPHHFLSGPAPNVYNDGGIIGTVSSRFARLKKWRRRVLCIDCSCASGFGFSVRFFVAFFVAFSWSFLSVPAYAASSP